MCLKFTRMCVSKNSDDGQCDRQGGPREACGVVAVYGVDNAALTLYNGLFALQHRGQEGAGMVVSDGKILHYWAPRENLWVTVD